MSIPVITSLTQAGPGVGSAVTVHGTGFTQVCDVLFYGPTWDTPGDTTQGPYASKVYDPNPTHGGDDLGGLTIVSDTEMQVVIPPRAVTGKIQATGGGGTSNFSSQVVTVA